MKKSVYRLQLVTYGTICFIGIIYILHAGSFIFIPLVWSIFLALALQPISTWLENKRFPRTLAIAIAFLGVSSVMVLILYLFVSQLSSLIKDIPGIGEKIQVFLERAEQTIKNQFGVENAFRYINPEMGGFINDANMGSVIRFTTTTVTTLTLLPVFTFLFLYYKDFFKEFITKVTDNTHHHYFDWLAEAMELVKKYLTGMLIVTIIVSILASVIFYMLGIKYYMLFGLFTAVCNLIPYVGVILGSIITILYVMLTTDQLWYPILTLILLWLLQVIENNLITPVVVGGRIKLNPLAVIIAILAGGGLWGVSGMILFIPLVGIIKIVFDKTDSLKPFSYLLGDDVPVYESKENFFIHFKNIIKNSIRGKTHPSQGNI